MYYNNVQIFPNIRSPLSTINSPKGMSLMEVLASMFVICIGLLGVLAVIPYGAYQTAKARNAENTSWILDAAEKDLRVMELAKPENWTVQNNSPAWLTSINGGVNVFLNHSTSDDRILNCSQFLMVDPFGDTPIQNSSHIYQIGMNFTNPQMIPQLLRERMRGQDDLVYTTHSDKRTDFSGQDNKILSSGQYTWFFMFQPEVSSSYQPGGNPPASLIQVPWTTSGTTFNIEDRADIDILACYNRVPGPEEQRILCTFLSSYYNNSISVRIQSGDYDLKNTKYVFLSWDHTSEPRADGGWYKVINVTDPDPVNFTRDVFLTCHGGTLYSGTGTNPQMLIIPGVMYHKRVRGVTIR
jgi:prepilin-type N-terminal cleavage/methylation domain-containing protein